MGLIVIVQTSAKVVLMIQTQAGGGFTDHSIGVHFMTGKEQEKFYRENEVYD